MVKKASAETEIEKTHIHTPTHQQTGMKHIHTSIRVSIFVSINNENIKIPECNSIACK